MAKNHQAKKAYLKAYREANKDKLREQQKVYAAKNKEKLLDARRTWRAKNSDRLNAAGRDYWQRNKNTISQKHKEYGESHPEVLAKGQRNYRQSEKGKKYFKTWNQKNREKLNEYARNWRAKPESKIRVAEQAVARRKTEAYKVWKESYADRIRAHALAAYYRHRDHTTEYWRIYGGPYARRMALFVKWDKCEGLCYICGLGVPIDEFHIDHVIPKTKGGTNEIQNLMPVHGTCNIKKGNKLNYPVVRQDLIDIAACVKACPRKPSKQQRLKEAA